VRHRAGLVVAAGVCGAVAVAAPASAGVVRGVTIDCVGDSVVGRVRLRGAGDGVTRITLLGRTGEGRFTALARTTARTERGDTEVTYTFALRRHRGEYRVRAWSGEDPRASSGEDRGRASSVEDRARASSVEDRARASSVEDRARASSVEDRARASGGDESRASEVVHDRTCQPPAEVPEAGAAAAVPLAMGAAGGAAWYLRRRRAGRR
jgi:hypothetical protein